MDAVKNKTRDPRDLLFYIIMKAVNCVMSIFWRYGDNLFLNGWSWVRLSDGKCSLNILIEGKMCFSNKRIANEF